MRAWRRLLSPLLAAASLLYLVAMVVSGAMPVQRQLARFEARGVLGLPPERIQRVELSRGTERLTLRRTGENAWARPDGSDIGEAGRRISTAIRMLHNSAPVREIDAADLVGIDTAPFGLDPPQLAATLYAEDGAPVLAARFGARNPEEYLQYMRLEGEAGLYLMSRFIGAEWSEAMDAVSGR
jgi:hypothetical protein